MGSFLGESTRSHRKNQPATATRVVWLISVWRKVQRCRCLMPGHFTNLHHLIEVSNGGSLVLRSISRFACSVFRLWGSTGILTQNEGEISWTAVLKTLLGFCDIYPSADHQRNIAEKDISWKMLKSPRWDQNLTVRVSINGFCSGFRLLKEWWFDFQSYIERELLPNH